MKKLFIFLLLPLFIACSSDDNEFDPAEQKQDYTSFVIENNSNNGVLKNVVAGYKMADNTLKEIANLGNIQSGKTSKEITVDFAKTKEVLIFVGELSSGDYSDILILTDYKEFKLKENTKNIYTLPDNKFMELTNVKHNDATQYPQK